MRKLNCDDHISNRCKKAYGELNALVRIAPFIGLPKRGILMNACSNSQLSYCPLIWMCHSRINNRKKNRFHGRCSRFICNDKKSWVSELQYFKWTLLFLFIGGTLNLWLLKYFEIVETYYQLF